MARALTEEERAIKKRAVVAFAQMGMAVKVAAQAAGIAYSTVFKWMNEDSEFKTQCETSNAVAIQVYTEALLKAAKEGNASAITFFLSRRGGEEWKEGMDAKQLDALAKIVSFLSESGGLLPKKVDDSTLVDKCVLSTLELTSEGVKASL